MKVFMNTKYGHKVSLSLTFSWKISRNVHQNVQIQMFLMQINGII